MIFNYKLNSIVKILIKSFSNNSGYVIKFKITVIFIKQYNNEQKSFSIRLIFINFSFWIQLFLTKITKDMNLLI